MVILCALEKPTRGLPRTRLPSSAHKLARFFSTNAAKSVSARCRICSCLQRRRRRQRGPSFCVCTRYEALQLSHPSRKTHIAGGVQVRFPTPARDCGSSLAALPFPEKENDRQRCVPLPYLISDFFFLFFFSKLIFFICDGYLLGFS